MSRLVADLRARREFLEAERSAIDEALRVLDPPVRESRRPPLKGRVLAELTASPGARGSHIALALGVDPDQVSAELEHLMRQGEVSRSGLGWEVAPTPRSG